MNTEEISERQLYKFSGPPENWITAIKFMTWGLEDKHLDRWKQIEPGDIFLMHSMGTNTIVKEARSSIIGFGVVSPAFSRKDGPLWLQEIVQRKNIWSLLVPFSEIYLFSELRSPEVLEAPTTSNIELIIKEAKELLTNAPTLPEGFPQMGSFSSVRPEIVARIFEEASRFYLYNSNENVRETYMRPSPLRKIDRPEQILRKPVSLSNLETIKKKTIMLGKVTFAKDLQYNERAESAHHETLSFLFELLKSQGYDTYSNSHVDLFAIRGDQSYLFEVKSFNQKNFRSQSRKGVVQLFEYEYFEIRKFLEDRDKKVRPNKALIYSQEPIDTNYINFINHLNMSVGYFSSRKFVASGQKSSLTNIIA